MRSRTLLRSGTLAAVVLAGTGCATQGDVARPRISISEYQAFSSGAPAWHQVPAVSNEPGMVLVTRPNG